ncbi:mannose-1-phosphate guanylyltransferase [Christensenellaceae bacterium OttesenSCG-928-K19]|nr:mannose-1-phosphate guanylyltransferase [Christensenellaceae bacterium OttesenSCG-928-K19]
MKLCSIILAGGSGTRLWPLSDNEIPKQFLALFSDDSMIVETSNRVLPRVPMAQQYVLTGEKYRVLTEETFDGKINVLAEPQAKNTAPCILWAAQKIAKDLGGETIIVVQPSDHAIGDGQAFLQALDTAAATARKGSIVTFGIVPSRAETGYGYIEIENMDYSANLTAKKALAFREKPDKQTAQEYLAAGNYLWNSGMFIFRADVMINEFKQHCPEVYSCFGDIDPDDMTQVKEAFEKTPSISIDYAIMERSQNVFCIPSAYGWSDVGGYQSLHEESEKDENGNVLRGNIIAEDTKNCYINGTRRIVCIGLDDLVVVESDHTILVAKKDSSEKVGTIAKQMMKK